MFVASLILKCLLYAATIESFNASIISTFDIPRSLSSSSQASYKPVTLIIFISFHFINFVY